MFSVMFEVHPRAGRFDDYLALAGRLKPILERIDGFVDNERFESLARPGWLLSHSTWRDEKSVVRWRTEGEHHGVQEQGRAEIFEDYRLRVGEIVADSAPPAGMKLVEQRLDETETGAAKLATLTEIVTSQAQASANGAGLSAAAAGLDLSHPDLVEYEIFRSIYRPGKFALLAGWKSAAAGLAWRPRAGDASFELRHRAIRVVRHYGMFDRRESPQFHAPASRRNQPA
ncbi:MAG: antibiotic biosynthesis monooxygenase [Ramlibacter sp.]|nr:antibiotic biosynthesis monooxygenase [Ramlibacter sp.]